MKWRGGREGGRDGGDWKWATFELLSVRGSKFLLVLSAVPGNRSQGRTWDCAHSSLLVSLSLSGCLSTSPSAPLPLVTALLPLLSLLSCHYSPSSSSLLSLLPVIFCLSQLLHCLSLLPLFLPHVLHLSVVSFSSPPSPPLRPNCTEVIHLSHVLTATALRPVSHCWAEAQ